VPKCDDVTVTWCGLQVLQGNVNTYIAELREIDPAIIARRIRFVPYSVHPKPACMRVELYGCTWTGLFLLCDFCHAAWSAIGMILSVYLSVSEAVQMVKRYILQQKCLNKWIGSAPFQSLQAYTDPFLSNSLLQKI